MNPVQQSLPQSYLLQIDRVGSYRLLLSKQIILAGPHAEKSQHTVQFLGRLSKEHALIQRVTEGYTISPRQGLVQRNRQTIMKQSVPENCLTGETLLMQGEQMTLAPGVSVSLRENSPLCRTALLQVAETGRLKDPVAGVVLMDQLLILGPGAQANIVCPHWNSTAALVYRNGSFAFHSLGGNFSSSDTAKATSQEVPLKTHVCLAEMGLYLEPDDDIEQVAFDRSGV